MKLRPNSTQPQIFKDGDYTHPWYTYQNNEKDIGQKWVYDSTLNKPNPPSQEAIEKAKFVDKTYEWSRGNDIRSRNKRTSK